MVTGYILSRLIIHSKYCPVLHPLPPGVFQGAGYPVVAGGSEGQALYKLYKAEDNALKLLPPDHLQSTKT